MHIRTARHATNAESTSHRGSERDGGETTRVAVLLAGGMACFGSATPTSAIVGRSFPVWLGSAARLLLAGVVLAPLAVARSRRSSESPVLERLRSTSAGDRAALAGMAVVGTFGFSALMLVGMREAPGAVAATVMAATPAVTALGAIIFLGDRLGVAHLVSLALAVGGVVLVNVFADTTQGSGDRVVIGSLLVFGAVVCEATYSLLGKRLTNALQPVDIATVAAVGGALVFLPIAIVQAIGFEWSRPTVGQWIALLWWGTGTMALGSVLWFDGMRRVQAATAAVFMGVMPISALIGSYILLGEAFQWIHLMGIALVIGGLVAVVRGGGTVH